VSQGRVLYHLMRADFLERIRRYNFLVLLVLTIFVGYAFVPPVSATYAVLNLGGYRGTYNSAWVGTMVAVLTSVWLAIFGFFPVKNTIERDQQTGVGQIIATTPCSKFLYVLGKACSNFAVLAIMVCVLALAAVAMQLVRGEDLRLNGWALLAPFLFIPLPTMAVVAALAVLFERPAETVLMVTYDDDTLTFVLPEGPRPPGRTRADVLVDLALRVLPTVGPPRTAAAPPSSTTPAPAVAAGGSG